MPICIEYLGFFANNKKAKVHNVFVNKRESFLLLLKLKSVIYKILTPKTWSQTMVPQLEEKNKQNGPNSVTKKHESCPNSKLKHPYMNTSQK